MSTAVAIPRTLTFVRQEDGRITTLGILQLNSHLDEAECLEAIKAATTQWINETESGKQLWSYSCKDLNIGDLASGAAFEDPVFQDALKARGVEFVDCTLGDCDDAICFDEVLVKEDELVTA